jgi:hypothetical protein
MSKILEWLRSNKLFLIASIWLSGICIGSIQLIKTRANPRQYGGKTVYNCVENWSDEYYGRVYTLVVFVATFALPVLILLFAYSTIGFHIWRHVTPGNPDQMRDERSGSRKDKVSLDGFDCFKCTRIAYIYILKFKCKTFDLITLPNSIKID